MKLLKRILKNEAGQVLPMALILLVLGGLLVVPTLSFMTTNLNANRQINDANSGTYAADAGIGYAYSRFAHDATFQPEDPNFGFPPEMNPVNGYVVSLAKLPVGDTWRITSVAHNTATGEDRTIIAYFRANASQFETGPSVFDYAVATLNGNLTMTGSSSITSDCSPKPCNEGNVWVNGNINLDWTPKIEGDANVTGSCNRPGNILGVYTPGSEPTERPAWLDDQLDCHVAGTNVPPPANCTGGTQHAGDWKLDWGKEGTYNGTHIVVRDMIISGTGGDGKFTFNGPVCVGRNLIIQSGANFVTFNAPVKVTGYVAFSGTGTVEFKNPAPQQTIAYGYHSIGTQQGSAIYISGYSATAILTNVLCGTNGVVDAKLQESYDAVTWTDFSPCGAFQQVTELNDNANVRLNYTGTAPYLRVVTSVSGAQCQFGANIVKNTTLYIGKYFECGGSRSAQFEGPVIVNGGALKSNQYIVYIGGSKYSGVAWDMRFMSTLRATEPTPNCNHKIYLGGSKVFEFYDVVYTNVSADLEGSTGSNMTFTKAFIADCNIIVGGSSMVDAPPTTSPIFCSRHGYIDLSGATKVDAIIYAPEGNVHVSGSSELEGAIVAKSALLEGAVKLKYPVVLRERQDVSPPEQGEPTQGESTFSIVSYTMQ